MVKFMWEVKMFLVGRSRLDFLNTGIFDRLIRNCLFCSEGGLLNLWKRHWCILRDETLMWFRGRLVCFQKFVFPLKNIINDNNEHHHQWDRCNAVSINESVGHTVVVHASLISVTRV